MKPSIEKNFQSLTWRQHLLRTVIIVVVSILLGLLTNALNAHPINILSPNGPGAWPDRAVRITVTALKEALAASAGKNGSPGILLLDVRGATEFKAGHAPTAVHVPAAQFIENYGRLNLSTLLNRAEFTVIICESDECPTADRAARVLKDLKHNNVRVLQNGWMAYTKAGMEIVR